MSEKKAKLPETLPKPRLDEAYAQLAFFYFLPDPEQFAWDHWCDERVWQIVEAPVTRDEFEQRVELGAGAHLLARQSHCRRTAAALAGAQDTSRSASRECRRCRARLPCRTRSTSCR